MKKIKLILPVLFSLLLAGAGCNNEEAEVEVDVKDTTTVADTLHVDPENFSDPH